MMKLMKKLKIMLHGQCPYSTQNLKLTAQQTCFYINPI